MTTRGLRMALGGLAVVASACAASQPDMSREIGATPAAAAVKIQGEMTSDGVECPAMRADNGAVYTLLGDLKGFKKGDRVTVEGTPVQMSFCMQGTTLQVTQIARRPPGG